MFGCRERLLAPPFTAKYRHTLAITANIRWAEPLGDTGRSTGGFRLSIRGVI